MTYEEYVELPGIRASDLIMITKNPAHYRWHKDHQSDLPAMRLGRIIHTAVLEPHRFEHVVFSGDRRTKAGKEEYLALENSGYAIVSKEENDMINGMVESVNKHIAAQKFLKESQHEVVVQWDKCKARVDMIGDTFVCDLKTCIDASSRAVSHSILKYGYHIQAAHYLAGTNLGRMIFIFVEKNPPYLTAVYELHFDSLQVGRTARRDAMDLLAACEESGIWPGYSNQVETIDLPAYAMGLEDCNE